MLREKQKSRLERKRRFFGTIILFIFVFEILFFIPRPAQALFGVGDISFTTLISDIPGNIWRGIDKIIKEVTATTFKNALATFTQQMAYKVATKLASGAAGQKPLFITEEFTKDLRDSADAAGGDFLDSLSTEAWGFSLCDVDPSIRIDIETDLALDLGLAEPREAKCTGTDILKSITKSRPVEVSGGFGLGIAGQDPAQISRALLGSFPDIFSPEGSNLGQYLNIHSQARLKQEEAKKKAEEEQEKEFLPLEEIITKGKKTPAAAVESTFGLSLAEAAAPTKEYTGSLVADFIGVFANTFIKKYLEAILTKGLNPATDYSTKDDSSGFLATQGASGIAAAEAKFASFLQPNLRGGSAVDILNKLSSCPTSFTEVENCVMDTNFRIAVDQHLRVEEAIERGYLDGNKPFGFGPGGAQLDYKNGYPYRSLVIMRRHRIIPVSWELAALYLRNFGAQNITLNVLMDAYDNLDSPYYHLVDPDWVLKAPDNYCRRKGYGEGLVFNEYIDLDGFNATPKVQLLERQETCVDDQSCIVENPDGTCQAYGYCTKEQPIWKFSGEQCPAYYDSCKNYQRRDGNQFSYLENTLEFNNCSPDNVGCQWYCKEFDDTEDQWECYWDSVELNYSHYFDGNPPWEGVGEYQDWLAHLDASAQTCDASAEGCSEFIRTTHGTNLLANSSFEQYEGDADDGAADYFGFCDENSTNPGIGCLRDNECGGTGICKGWRQEVGIPPTSESFAVTKDSADVYLGDTAVNAQDGVELEQRVDTGHPVYQRTFTFSFWANPQTTGCGIRAYLYAYDGSTSEDLIDYKDFIDIPDGWNRYSFTATSTNNLHQDYNYLSVEIANDAACNDTLIDAAMLEESAELNDYVDYGEINQLYLNGQRLECEEDDVGCLFYTPVAGGDPVPGKYTSEDICPADKVGCKAYEETPLTNVVPDPNNVNRTGKYCSESPYQACENDAQCAGGTNYCLPSISLIPSTGTTCSAAHVGCEEYTNLDEVAKGGEGKEYYSFLKQCVPLDDPDIATYYAWEGDEVAGYQLRAFRLKKSDVGPPNPAPCTHLEVGQNLPLACEDSSNTVIDCGPLGTDEYGTNPDCTEFFDSDLNTFFRYKSQTVTASDNCHPERNTLDDNVYYGLPEESTSCPAAAAGCREYKGNAGYNIRVIFDDDFEDGTTQGWSFGSNSSESVLIGGHSLVLDDNNDATKDVSDQVTQGKTYLLSFWAKAPDSIDAGDFVASFYNGVDHLVFPGSDSVASSQDYWQQYTLGPLVLDREVSDEEIWLTDTRTDGNMGDPSIFYDNIVLTETTQHVYLIRGSADLCQGEENCEAYRDPDGQIHYLKSFSKLCEEELAGCEALINTQNTPNPFVETFGSEAESTITVPADNTVILVNNAQVYCNAADQGCRALGKPNIDQDDFLVDYDTVYLKDNAENYSTIWCENSEVGCEEYNFEGGLGKAYFKDPGERVCEYKQEPGGVEYYWYKKGTADLCNTASTPSPTGPDQPAADWVGACTDQYNGCTAYRDPLDPLIPNNCDPSFPYEEDSLGNSIRECSDTSLNAGDPCTTNSDCFGLGNGGTCLPYPGCQTYYYINSSVDETSCNGVVDEEKGCKLFFDTDVPPNVYTADLSPDGPIDGFCDENSNNYGQSCASDADCYPLGDGKCIINNLESGAPLPCEDTVTDVSDNLFCDSNKVLQVERDRICDEWLYCRTSLEVDDPTDTDGDGKTKEEVCLEIGTCGELGTGGTCVQTVNQDPINVTGDDQPPPQNYPFEEFQNYSGFVSAGLNYGCVDDHTISCTVATEAIDCAGAAGGTCEIIEGYFPYSAMYEVGLGGASVRDLVNYGDFEPNSIEGFMVCDDTANNRGEACLVVDTVSNHCIDEDGEPITPEVCNDINDDETWTTLNPTIGLVKVVEGDVNDEGNTALDENNYLRFSPGLSQAEVQGVKSNLGTNILNGQEYIAAFDFKFNSLPQEGEEEITVALAQYDASYNDLWFEELGKFNGTTGWQQYIIGPHTIQSIPNENEDTYLAFYNDNAAYLYSFSLDDVSLKPVLTVQEDPPGTFNYLARSCRAYPRNDSQVCHYIDDDLVEFNGWKGYCIETDPTNPDRCLTWWPVDIISGESSVFGTIEPAGYQGRIPLYMCLSTDGNYPYHTNIGTDNRREQDWGDTSRCRRIEPLPGDVDCLNEEENGNDDQSRYAFIPAVGNEVGLKEYEIAHVQLTALAREHGGAEWPEPDSIAKIYKDPNLTSFSGQDGWIERCPDLDRMCENPYGAGCSDCPVNCDVADRLFYDGDEEWEFCWDGDTEDSSKDNELGIALVFDDDTKEFQGYYTYTHDDKNTGWVSWEVTFYLRDACGVVTKVVGSLGENRAWAQRTDASSSYRVEETQGSGQDLNYSYPEDFAPFGSIIASNADPVVDPGGWDGKLNESGNQPVIIEEADTNYEDPSLIGPPNYQVRAGTAYACTGTPLSSEGSCSGKRCWGGGETGQPCRVDADCDDGDPKTPFDFCFGVGTCSETLKVCQGGTYDGTECDSNSDCGGGECIPNNCTSDADCPGDDNICIGGSASSQTHDYGKDRLKRLFAKVYEAWCWDGSSYVDISDSACTGSESAIQAWQNNYEAMLVCTSDPRPDGPDDYCGILPNVYNILVNGASGDVTLSGGGQITLTFNTFVDVDQQPLEAITIDWGDDGVPTPIPWGGAPKTDPAAPHVVSHNYEYNSDDGPYDATIRILIEDNWQFCNDPSGRACSLANGNDVYPGTIRVCSPEGDCL